MPKIKKINQSVGKAVEQLELSYGTLCNEIWYSYFGKQLINFLES